MELKINIDLKGVNTAFRLFPKSAAKSFARLVNDMAFSFKDAAPGILGKHFTIRNPAYVSQAFRVEKAKPGKNPVATVGPIVNEKKYKNFTGWAEALGEPPKLKRAKRSIGLNARGGNMRGRPKPGATLDPKKPLADSRTIPLSGSQAVQAAIQRAFGEQGIGARVIIREGGGFPEGLYEVTDKGGDDLAPEVQILQKFGETIVTEQVNWPEETMARIAPWYSPERIFQDYIAPLFTGK
jgi:hypothetical protein